MHNIFTPEDDERLKAELEASLKSLGNLKLELPAISEEQAAFDRSVLAFVLAEFPSSSTPTPPTTPTPVLVGPSQRISIRVPHPVLEATKREAGRLGIRYQTLINRHLAITSAHW